MTKKDDYLLGVISQNTTLDNNNDQEQLLKNKFQNLDLLVNDDGDNNQNDYTTKKGEASDIKTFLHEIRTKSLIYYAIFIVLVISLTIFFL